MMKSKTFFSILVFSLALVSSFATFGAEAVLAETGNVSVTTTDIYGDALRIPAEARKAVLSNPEAVQQLSNNLIIRRAIAAQAVQEGMDKDPAVQAAIRIARDRILSDQIFARADAANKPPTAIVEAIAETNYKANPKRFDLPEERAASHILIKTATPEAMAKARLILLELQRGADFAKLARENSEDSTSKDGGYLGYFPPGQMVGPFDAAVQKMEKPGELSGIVESQFGYHIIKFEGKRPPGIRPFSVVKPILMREAETKIITEKRVEMTQKVYDSLKFDKAAIEAFSAANQ